MAPVHKSRISILHRKRVSSQKLLVDEGMASHLKRKRCFRRRLIASSLSPEERSAASAESTEHLQSDDSSSSAHSIEEHFGDTDEIQSIRLLPSVSLEQYVTSYSSTRLLLISAAGHGGCCMQMSKLIVYSLDSQPCRSEGLIHKIGREAHQRPAGLYLCLASDSGRFFIESRRPGATEDSSKYQGTCTFRRHASVGGV